jgi:hypothetical protein
MRGTGSVVFFMLGVGLLYFAWNSHIIDAALAFVFNPTQATIGGRTSVAPATGHYA